MASKKWAFISRKSFYQAHAEFCRFITYVEGGLVWPEK